MKFLKKNNKLVKKNGKLVKTNDPAKCDCCGPPPPPVKYICAMRDSCTQHPLSFGVWSWLADGRWFVGRDQCRGQVPFNSCEIADMPKRPGAFEGERVEVGCKSATPSTTKQCITEEEFAKGGWIKVSGPHDTLQLCEAACNPPPPDCSCVPASVTVKFTAACAAGLPIDPEYVVPLVDQGGGAYSGTHPSGTVGAGASACAGGKWRVNFGTNLFNPATGPCVVGTVQGLACGETWTGDIGGGDQATLTLNGTPPAALAHNPLP
jgi:hypothetical protein